MKLMNMVMSAILVFAFIPGVSFADEDGLDTGAEMSDNQFDADLENAKENQPAPKKEVSKAKKHKKKGKKRIAKKKRKKKSKKKI